MNIPSLPKPEACQASLSRPCASGVVALESAELFQGGQEVVIRHDGQDYRLRITRQNKLILTK